MKKKWISLAAVLALSLSLAACGAKEQTATYTMQSETEGLVMTDTMTLQAKGDVVEEITEVIELDLTAFDEETQLALEELYGTMVDSYNAIEGVTGTLESADGVVTLTVVIDATGDAVTQLADAGLLQVDGNSEKLSLEATGEALAEGGYTLAE